MSGSYFNHIEKLTEWFELWSKEEGKLIKVENRPPMFTISNLVYDAIEKGHYHKTKNENIFECEVIINGDPHTFRIEIDNRNRITKTIKRRIGFY